MDVYTFEYRSRKYFVNLEELQKVGRIVIFPDMIIDVVEWEDNGTPRTVGVSEHPSFVRLSERTDKEEFLQIIGAVEAKNML